MHPASENATLAERLGALLDASRLTGETLAGALGWSPSKVSKIRNGRTIPSPDDIRAWVTQTGQPEEADELIALREAESIHVSRGKRLSEAGGEANLQRDIDDLTRSSARIRDAQLIIPGLLQIPGYARGIFTQVSTVYPGIDIDAAVDARMRRREVLHEEGRTFDFVIPYAALVMPPCPLDVMLSQLDRLMMTTDLSNVTLGIIPEGKQLPMSFINGFSMYDSLLVVESYGYEDQVTGSLAQVHHQIFDLLMTEASAGEDARRLIAKAAQSLKAG